MKRQPRNWLTLSLLFVVLLAACSPVSTIQPIHDSRIISVGTSFGQTFTAEGAGLSGISVLLAPSVSSSSGSLLFHLRTSPQSNDDLARARLPLSEISQQKYYKFDFQPQIDSQRRDYFIQVDVEGAGQVQLFTTPADSYLDGALYIDKNPQEAQLGFQLEYDHKAYLIGLAKIVFEWIKVLGVGILLFIVPGWALFDILWPGWHQQNWVSKLGLSGGLSLAIYPLLILWTGLVGLHLGPLYAITPPIFGLLSLLWKNRKNIFKFRTSFNYINYLRQRLSIVSIDNSFADLSILVILGLVVISRLSVVHSLDVPLFGDSYQHTMITQLLIDHRGLFNSWEPYADLSTFTYHFGFHSAAAVFHWMSNVSAARAVLWTGQLVNILAIISMYPLAYKIAKNRWAGVAALLVAGILSPMPMFYINWGRYTQLTGQAVLLVAIWIAWEMLDRPIQSVNKFTWFGKLINLNYLSLDFSSLVIVWLTLSGEALSHYRILILAILFFLAYLLLSLRNKTVMTIIVRIAWIGVGAAILFAPWFVHVFGGKILKIFAIQISTLPAAGSSAIELLNSTSNLQAYLPYSIWIILILCIVWSLLKWKRVLAIFPIWWFIIILATNPNWIGLPGNGAITNFAVLIAFYIPAGIVIGSTFGWLLTDLLGSGPITNVNNTSISTKIFLNVFIMLIICTLGIWGFSQRLKDLNLSKYALVTRPDERAITWIQTNTPTEARFLINSFSAFDDSVVVGSDGGWWLPLLANRQTVIPPLLYAAEQGSSPNYQQDVNDMILGIKRDGINNIDVIRHLTDHQINYIYIGQLQGRVNNPGSSLLDPAVIIADSHFQLLYHQDRVWIFKILP